MIAVDVTFDGAKTSGPNVRKVVDGLADAIARAFADVVRRRVERGDTAGQRRAGYRTGGMLRGVAHIKVGLSKAQVVFRGSSRGASGKSISNADKALTVLQATGVNVLALKESELVGLSDAIAGVLARAVGTQLPVKWSTPLPDGDLASVFANAMRGR